MKRTCIAVFSCAAALSVPAQTAAPVVTALGAYARSLQAPARLATDAAGSVYVTDPQAGQVVVFDAFGRQLATRSGFARPLGIAVDGQGNIYLAEAQTGSVRVFDAQWRFLYKLGLGNGEFQLPNHIALAPASSGGAVYVSDSKADAVKVYVGATLTNHFGGTGTNNGQFDFPAGICVSPSGEVFVVDQNNDRVQVFDHAGSFLRAFGLGASSPSGRSQAAFLDHAGRLYVADAFQGTVRVFDGASGAPLSSVGTFGEMPGQLSSPAGLALDPQGRLCVASANNGRVELFGLDGFVHLSTSPAAGVVAAGTNLVFSALAGGPGPFFFQWQRDGRAVGHATNDTLTILGAGAADSGGYSVVVIGPSGSFTSSVAQVAVLAPPRIISDPLSQTVLRGANVVLTVIAIGSTLSYQWQRNGLNLDGVTNNTLVLPDAQTFQAGLYSVVVSNAVGVVASAPATLAVLVPPVVMEIVSSSMATNRLLHLLLNADPGVGYSLDASTNLLQWQSLTNFMHEAGLFEFTDADSTNFWNRYYRLRWVP